MVVVPAANVSKIVAIRSQVGFDETIPYLLSGLVLRKKNKNVAEPTSSSASSASDSFTGGFCIVPINSWTDRPKSHVLYSRFVLNPIQLEGSRCPLQLGSHVMLSKDFPLLWKYRPSSRISLPSSLSADTLLGIRPQLPTRRPSTCQVLEEVQGNCKQHWWSQKIQVLLKENIPEPD